MHAVDLLLTATDWSNKRSIFGTSADSVPGALQRLIAASDEAEAKAAYWDIDNCVVVQGSLFESSEFVIAPVMCALSAEISSVARRRCLDLLIEIVNGGPDETELDAGNVNLAQRCLDIARMGKWAMYALIDDEDVRIRRSIIELLDTIEADRDLLRSVVVKRAGEETDPQTLMLIEQASHRGRPSGGRQSAHVDD